MKTKVCIKCERELPITNEYFRKDKRSKDGFINTCKECKAKQDKQYYESNKDKISEKSKQYREKNKDLIIKYKKKYREKNRDTLLKRDKLYREENKVKVSETKKRWYKEHLEECAEKRKKYYEKNKEILLQKQKQYNEENKEIILDRHRRYYREHLEERRIYRRKHLTERRIYRHNRSSLEKKLPSTLTSKQWEEIKLYFNNACAYCGRKLPLEQEHFIAITKNGEFTHNNIICACKSCNSSKSNSDFFEWYPKYRYYSKKREQAILKFLGYKDDKQQLTLIL